MTWCRRPWWSPVVVLAAVVLSGCSGDDRAGQPQSTSSMMTSSSATSSTSSAPESGPVAPSLPPGDDATVAVIVDGDTLRTDDDVRVRLLNVDTPEPSQDECWSAEATQRLRELIPPGTPVRLAYDIDRYDRYGRTLAHVYRLGDGLWVNQQLVEDGAAVAYVLAPNDTYYDEIRAAADAAARDGRGLWGACGSGSGAGSAAGNGAADRGAAGARSGDSTVVAPERAGCDPAYPTVCIPPSPPDLDCGDIAARRFVVLPPDPHRFDGGGDGIGCERD